MTEQEIQEDIAWMERGEYYSSASVDVENHAINTGNETLYNVERASHCLPLEMWEFLLDKMVSKLPAHPTYDAPEDDLPF